MPTQTYPSPNKVIESTPSYSEHALSPTIKSTKCEEQRVGITTLKPANDRIEEPNPRSSLS
jgi:hypothetical protein